MRKPAKEDPQGGSRAKERGSLDRGRGAAALATGPIEIPPNTPAPGPGPFDTQLMLAAPAELPAEAASHAAPSAKWAGRDPKTGKVIPHTRSEKVALVVAQYSASGLGKNEIACLLNIRPGHLEEFYYRELHNGLNRTVAEVAGAMIKRAKSKTLNPVAQRAGEFYLQARAGWRTGDQKQQLDVPTLNIVIHT